MKEILELMAKKYPGIIDEELGYPAIVIYDDESGRIVKNGTRENYDKTNVLFEFSSISELIEHLKSSDKVVYEDTLLGDVDEEFHY